MCGEAAAIDFVRELMYTTGEEMEVTPGNMETRLWLTGPGERMHPHKSITSSLNDR